MTIMNYDIIRAGEKDMKSRIIYMGTPDFAQEILRHLLAFEDIEIVGVVTQPDRFVGRKKILTYSEVKEEALKHDLMLFQPEKIGTIVNQLADLKADAIITCAYGQFLPLSILNLTPRGVINIHASLLPKYRGGAPMQYALLKGEEKTGITLMQSVLKMDAGGIYSQLELTIDMDDTLSSLEPKLIDTAKKILNRDLSSILDGHLKPIEQDENLVSFAPTIKREDELLDFSQEGREIYNHIRALIDNPYAYGYLDDKKIKFCEADYLDLMHRFDSGEIIDFNKKELVIALNGGILRVTKCQLEGKPKMDVKDLYNGYHKQWKGLKVVSHVKQ